MKGKETSYHTVVPIQDLKIIDEVYKCVMKAPLITVSHKELLPLFHDLHQHHQEKVMLKCIANPSTNVISTNITEVMPFAQFKLDAVEPCNALLSATPSAGQVITQLLPIILPDPIEQYINNLCSGEPKDPNRLKVTEESCN